MSSHGSRSRRFTLPQDRLSRVLLAAFVVIAIITGVVAFKFVSNFVSTWNLTDLDPPLSPYTWVIWKYHWEIPVPGAYTLMVRAWDKRGQVQPSKLEQAYPAGASGYHTVVALVS